MNIISKCHHLSPFSFRLFKYKSCSSAMVSDKKVVFPRLPTKLLALFSWPTFQCLFSILDQFLQCCASAAAAYCDMACLDSKCLVKEKLFWSHGMLRAVSYKCKSHFLSASVDVVLEPNLLPQLRSFTVTGLLTLWWDIEPG
ncbi:hypothetical protein NL108_001478 [Boleophthalmus pectinirostris]|nr:hypothetical protein NL108_001478 [Boleophthalmus pectinirostris]